MADKRIPALGLTFGLLAWSLLPGRRHPLTQASLAAALAVLTKAPLGLRPPALWAGLRLGSAAASLVRASAKGATVCEAELHADRTATLVLQSKRSKRVEWAVTFHRVARQGKPVKLYQDNPQN